MENEKVIDRLGEFCAWVGDCDFIMIACRTRFFAHDSKLDACGIPTNGQSGFVEISPADAFRLFENFNPKK